MNPLEKTQGPCAILAGAGTGKTRALVEKIKYILENKIYPPEKIVCLTFSNEAANSLRERILPIIKSEKEPIIKTFHSFCSELLKKYGGKIGITNFKILLPDDAKIMLHKNLKIPPRLCHQYINEIGIAKDLGISVDLLSEYLEKETEKDIENLNKNLEVSRFELHTMHLQKEKSKEKKELLKSKIEKLEKTIDKIKFLKAWESYEKLKNKKSLHDYSDLNKNALILLDKAPEIAEEFEYFLIDEFQDTNKLQCDLIEKIAPHKNITIVGDLNQSIYRFRGAYKDNFVNFKKAFNVSTNDIFTLDRSYRSTNKILEAAHQLIENNYSNKKECFKVLSALNKEGNKIKVYELDDGKEEVRKIIEIINDELARGTPEKEICVMFRAHNQSKILKNYLSNQGINFTAIAKKSLFKMPVIAIVRSYLEILDRINRKESGGENAIWSLVHHSSFPNEDEIIIGNFLRENKEEESICIKFINFAAGLELSEKGKFILHRIIKIIKSLIPNSKTKAVELIKQVYEKIGFEKDKIEDNKEKVLILEKFLSLAQEHEEIESENLADFLYHMQIIDSLGIEIESPSLDNGGIRIMTSHSTKGLEYETVIVSNLVQRRFPMEKLNSSLMPSELSPEIKELIKNMPKEEAENFITKHEMQNQLMEERRLCYVSFTRAKSNLYLTYANKYGAMKYPPSQFLYEINYKNNKDIEFIKDSKKEYQEINAEAKEAKKELILKKEISFSPSALQLFDECQKKYEYRYIYNMPEPIPASWDAIKLGSFIHKILEEGVKNNIKEEKQFIDLAKTMQMDEKWQFINLEEALPLIKIFFHRNKNKYSEKSLTEKWLEIKLENLTFKGIADRIDFNNDGIEIIDYKTGKTEIKPRYRNWQLGFYALASKLLGSPKRLILETLQKETPIEFVLDEQGNAKEIHSQRTFFNLNEVKQELIETAKKILDCRKNSFSPCPIEKNCTFCDEWVY